MRLLKFALAFAFMAEPCFGLSSEAHVVDHADQGYSFQEKEEQMHWDQTDVLDPDRRVSLSWTVDKDNKTITFNLTAATLGWVGVGFNSKGAMIGADIVVGWAKDGKTYFTDRHATANTLPAVDSSQDYTLLASSETGNYTSLVFQRKLDTCDPDDYNFEGGTTSVLYAYGETDPDGDDPYYHASNRGSKSLLLLDPARAAFPDDAKTFELRLPSVTIPHDKDTTYWCTIFRGPLLETKHHYIGNEAIVSEGSEIHFHHFILYECGMTENENQEYFENLLTDYPGGFECFAEGSPTDFRNACSKVRIAWATGGLGDVYPPEAGYPIPTIDEGPIYYYMETHYDNQALVEGIVDTSGVRLYYTDQLRPYEIGIMLVAMPVSYTQLVPPGVKEFVSVGHASPECTQKWLPEDGINVFGILHHSHLTGRKMRTRIFRDGVELPWLLNDYSYDFSYQQTRLLEEPRIVLPGDQMTTECFLSTTGYDELVVGGLKTTDEMCESFLLYYPKVDMFVAESMPPPAFIDEFFGFSNVTYDIASFTVLVDDVPLQEYLADFDWASADLEGYQREVRFGQHTGNCIASWNDWFEAEELTIAYPEDFVEYVPPPRECPAHN